MKQPSQRHLIAVAAVAAGISIHPVRSEAQGLSPEIVAGIDSMITGKMATDRIPGLSVAVVVNGRLVWSDGYGFADLENFVPATARTRYRTASVGKTMTATAVMQLAERGVVDLDAPVQEYCPVFPPKRWPLTPRQLLGHLSGIRHYGGPRDEEELYSITHYDRVVDALAIFKDDSLLFEPGTQYLYSTYGYNVLGCVIEGAAGTTFLDYLRRNIFEPAGMHSTRDDDPFVIIRDRASGYRVSADSTKLENARAVDMSNKMPAGGFLSTAEDLVRFAAAFMNDELVTPWTRTTMLTPQHTRDGTTTGYGLGWALFPDELWYGEREAFHGGGTPGVSTMLYLLPERHFAVALMMNVEGVTDRVGLAAQIAKLVLGLGS